MESQALSRSLPQSLSARVGVRSEALSRRRDARTPSVPAWVAVALSPKQAAASSASDGRGEESFSLRMDSDRFLAKDDAKSASNHNLYISGRFET